MESAQNDSGQPSFFITLLPVFVVAHFAHHLLTALTVPMLPFIRNDFKLNYTQSALVSSAFSLSYGVGQLPSGWAADRFGPRILATIGILGVAMAGILVGISQTYIVLIMFLILMGLLGGGYHPASAPLISSSVEPEKRGRALGFHVVGGSASFFLTPIIAALIAGYWGWRGSYIGLAIPTAILGIIFYILLGHGKTDSHIQQVNEEHPVGPSKTPGSFRRLTAFLILTVLGGGAGYSIMGFIPLYIVDHFGASERTAASLLSVAWSAGLWASPLGGYLSDRFGRVRIILLSSIFSGVLIYLLKVVPFGWGLEGVFYINGLGIGTLLLFMGVSSFIRMPVSEAFIMSQAPVHRKSTIFGVYYFAMQQAGGVFAPIVGVMVDTYGFHTCFTIASVMVIGVTILCSVFLLEGRKVPS